MTLYYLINYYKLDLLEIPKYDTNLTIDQLISSIIYSLFIVKRHYTSSYKNDVMHLLSVKIKSTVDYRQEYPGHFTRLVPGYLSIEWQRRACQISLSEIVWAAEIKIKKQVASTKISSREVDRKAIKVRRPF